MANFTDPKFCKSILDLAQAYGPYEFWTQNLVPGCNPAATWRALMVVAALKDPLYTDSACKMLTHQDSRVRAWACTAVKELSPRKGFAEIQALTGDTSPRVRFHARRAVRAFQGIANRPMRMHGLGPRIMPVVLISEDDHASLLAMNLSLTKEGYQVQTAMDEPATVDFALKLRPQVIITDNAKGNDNLSGLNLTWDLCRRRELNDTLIFMYTADELETAFLWYGGDEYIQKPDLAMIGLKLKPYFLIR